MRLLAQSFGENGGFAGHYNSAILYYGENAVIKLPANFPQ